MKLICLFFINVLLIIPAFPQQVIVINISTGEPIENVAIFNQSKSSSILTDENGKAELTGFKKEDTLQFQHPSFLRYSISLQETGLLGVIKLERRIIFIPESIITASKFQENQREIPHMADIITQEKLNLVTAQNSADLLVSTGNVFVQKTQGGGGSPILRGFEANKILLVVDGVRLNNAIYRSGHLQNSITIDNAILEKVEVVYGPNAIMYGSDALGGVVHYITRDPEFSEDPGKIRTNASGYGQISTANSGWKTHMDFNVAGKKLGSLTSYTKSEFGDIRMGGYRNPFYEDYGKCLHFVQQYNNIDSMYNNSNTKIQRFTGYSQIDLLQKFRYKPTAKLDFTLNFQYSTSTDIPRYDMLNDYTDDGYLKYARYDYGPQKRWFGSLKTIYRTDNFFFNQLTSIIGYQRIEESRIWRQFREDDEYIQVENVDVGTLNLDFFKLLPPGGRLLYGVEINGNYIASNASIKNILTDEETKALSRYPDDGSNTSAYAAYIAYKRRLGKKIITEAGVRYNYSILNASYSNFEGNISSIQSMKMTNNAYTGSLGVVFLPSGRSKINILLSTGYRIPNLDDITKIRAKGGQITIPNPDVRAEYSYNAEVGLSKTFDGYIQINGSYFVTLLTNAIVRVPYTNPDGSDTIFYDNGYLKTYINDNSNRAIIHGFSITLLSDLNSNISFLSTLNYTYGHDLELNEPLAHIPPVYGKTNIAYKGKFFVHELYFIYNGWKRTGDMSKTGEDNEDEGTQYGFPGWYTINIRTTLIAGKTISLQFAVENIMDSFYKPYATAVAGPGLSIIGTLRVKI